MKHLLFSTFFLSLGISAQVPGTGTSGAGTVPGGTGMTMEDDTHVSPGGLGSNPAMKERLKTKTGTDPMGPGTIGHPTNRSSGSTRSRQSMSGENMSSATHQSSNRNPKTGQADETFGYEDEIGNSKEESTSKTLKINEAYPVGPYGEGGKKQAEEESETDQNTGP